MNKISVTNYPKKKVITLTLDEKGMKAVPYGFFLASEAAKADGKAEESAIFQKFFDHLYADFENQSQKVSV